MSHRPGIDLMVQADSVLMSHTGPPDGQAYKAGGPIADNVGGFSEVVYKM
jgi:formyl-CoA transferase/CoA:oxalate CoA-transferase